MERQLNRQVPRPNVKVDQLCFRQAAGLTGTVTHYSRAYLGGDYATKHTFNETTIIINFFLNQRITRTKATYRKKCQIVLKISQRWDKPS